eukprot:scaffold2876_cov123-Isochrysis_galbana.AAC.5
MSGPGSMFASTSWARTPRGNSYGCHRQSCESLKPDRTALRRAAHRAGAETSTACARWARPSRSAARASTAEPQP